MKQTPRMNRAREVKRVVELLSRSNPAKIILFGSQASGAHRSESDIDLCVLVDSYHGRPAFRIKQDLYRLLMAQHYDFPIDLDVHVYSLAEFENKLNRGDPFLRTIAGGQVLYERR